MKNLIQHLPAPLYYGLLLLACAVVIAILAHLVWRNFVHKDGQSMATAIGFPNLHNVVFIPVVLLWLVLVLVLLGGLFGLIFEILTAPPASENLFYVLRIAGLTGVLGATIALPFTMIRLRLTQKQTDTATESLFNEKINAATQGLYARRQATMALAPGGSYRQHQDFWQDDIVQRCAAIDRLEGLAKEERKEVPRIARLLSVYVRELSRDVPAAKAPDGATPEQLREWAQNLPALRSDMEKAAQTLGRLAGIAPEPLVNGEIDLRGANLQRADLNGLKFENALFKGAQLQGTDLRKAQLQGANLFRAQLQGADLGRAQLQGAFLGEAQLQGANLGEAQLQGANLFRAQLQGAFLGEAQLQGANLGEAQLQGAFLIRAQLQGAFLGEAQLQGANLIRAQLQGANLEGAQLQGANVFSAQLQGANLITAELQGANLFEAQLQGANLIRAQLQGAYLEGAQLQGANLIEAELQGATLGEAQFDAATSLNAATLRGAAFSEVDFTHIPQIMDHVADSFGDASVTLPGGVTPGSQDWPTHWPTEGLNGRDFEEAWRAWQATLPDGWDQPD